MTRTIGLTAILIGVMGLVILPAQEELFTTEGRLTEDEREQTYTIGLQSGIAVEVLVESEDFDSFVDARLPDGTRRSNDDYDRLNAGFQATITESGMLRVTVSAVFPEETGDFRLAIRRIPAPQPIFPGETIRGSIGKNDETDGILAQRYRLNGDEGSRVVIDVRSDEFDPLIEARDSFGRTYRDDDGGESGYDSRISYRFEDEGYLIVTVRGFFGSDLGEYEISVREAYARLRANYLGNLAQSDERAYDGAILDRFDLDAVEGEEVTILLESTEFDPMLYVSDPLGRSIARDDDSGGNRNSMITLSVPADGLYTIWVGSFDGISEGGYELTVYGAPDEEPDQDQSVSPAR